MTITHVIPYMHPHAGGPPVVVDRLCRGLAARGWKNQVITTDFMAGPGDSRWQDRLGDGYDLQVHKTKWLHSFAYSSTLAKAIRSAAESSALVHLHTLWTYPTYCAARICRKLDVPYVVASHGMIDPNSLERKRLKKRVYGRICEWPNLRRAHAMIYTHDEERRLAESAVSGLPRGFVVPLGADDPPQASRTELAGRFFAQYPQLREKDLIVFLGRMHPKKGLDLLIPAFANLVSSHARAHLLLVGPGDATYVSEINRRIEALGLAQRVTVTGPLAGESKWQALAASQVFVLPSYQENFALTVVEAMRIGVPVVLSKRVNIWRNVTDTGAGLACELTLDGVAGPIMQLLTDNELRTQCGASGERLAATQFNWDRCVAGTEQVYHTLLETSCLAGAGQR